MNYYINVDSRYRNNQVYQNCNDFAIPLVTDNSLSLQGLPIDNNSYFELGSIDPNFKNIDLQIYNCTIFNIKCTVDSIYIAGTYKKQTVPQFKYKGNLILQMPKSIGDTVFLASFSTLYVLKWSVYTSVDFWRDPQYSSITSVNDPANNVTKTLVFNISKSGFIYLMFDFSIPSINIRIQYNYIALTVSDSYSLFYLLNPSSKNNSGRSVVAIMGLDTYGRPATYQGHSWGYHVFTSNFTLQSTKEAGKINLLVDDADNIFASINVNPFQSVTTVANVPTEFIFNTKPTPHNIYTYNYETTNFIITSYNAHYWYDRYKTLVGENSYREWGYAIIKYGDNYTDSTGNSIDALVNYYGFNPEVLDLPTDTYYSDDIFHQMGEGDLYIVSSYHHTGSTVRLPLIVYTIPRAAISHINYGTGSADNLFNNNLTLYSASNVNNVELTGHVVNYDFLSPYVIDSSDNGEFIYIFVRDAEKNLSVFQYTPDTGNYYLLANIQIPSIYNASCIRALRYNNFFYIISPDYNPESEDPVQTYVYKFDIDANSLSLIYTFDSEASSEFINFSYSGQGIFTFLTCEHSSRIQILDMTSPNTPILLRDFTAYPSSIPIIYSDGYNMYLALGNTKNTTLQMYNINDISNITPVGQAYYDIGYINYINPDGRLYGRYRPTPQPTGPRSLRQTDSFFTGLDYRSYHYNENTQGIIHTATQAIQTANYTITDETGNYISFVFSMSNTTLTVYNCTNIKAVNTIKTFDLIGELNLPQFSSMPQISFYSINSALYILISTDKTLSIYSCNLSASYVYISFLDSITLSNSPIVQILIDNNYIWLFTEQNTICKLTYTFSLMTILPEQYINTDYTFFRGAHIYTYNDIATKYMFIFQSTIRENTPSAPFDSYNFLLFDVTADNEFIYISNLPYNIVPQVNSSILYTDFNNNPYIITYDNITPGFVIYDLSNLHSTDIFNNPNLTPIIISARLWAEDISRLNKVSLLRNVVIDNHVYLFASFAKSNSQDEYILILDLTNSNEIIAITENGLRMGGQYALNISIIDNYTNYTLVINCDNNSIALYDVTNIKYAAKYQAQPFSQYNPDVYNPDSSFQYKSYKLPTLGSAVCTKINNDGTDEWVNTFSSDIISGVYGENINISNITIDNAGLYIYVAGGFNKKLQSYNTKLQKLNEAIMPDNSYAGFISKFSAVDGSYSFIEVINGPYDDYIYKIQWSQQLQSIVLYGYTYSATLVQYAPQTSSLVYKPYVRTPQSVINNSSITSSFIYVINTDGIYMWNKCIYTLTPNKFVNANDLYTDNDSIIIVGNTDSDILNVTDSTQNLYTYTLASSNINSLYIYKFNTSGVLKSSQTIKLPENSVYSLYDTKIYSNTNEIIILPNIQTYIDKNYTIYNQDGTLALKGTTSQIIYTPVIKLVNQVYTTDVYGNYYSTIFYKNSPTYLYTPGKYIDYWLFVLNPSTNYRVKNNYIENSIYKISINGFIDLTTIDRLFTSMNSIQNSGLYYKFNLSTDQLVGIAKATQVGNTLSLDNIYSDNYQTDNYNQYYTVDSSKNIIKLSDITAQTSLSPYIYILQVNPTPTYTLQFFPSNIYGSITFNVQLLSLTMPNRPILYGGVSSSFNVIPYIYVNITPEYDMSHGEDKILSVVYDNNPTTNNSIEFQLVMSPGSATNNFVTFSATSSARVKFINDVKRIRFTILDHKGSILQYDRAPNKTGDKSYGYTVPEDLFNINMRLQFST